MVARLSEYSAQFPNIEADLSEYSPNLPIGYQLVELYRQQQDDVNVNVAASEMRVALNEAIEGVLPIFAVVIAKPSDKPAYTAEISFSSAVALRFSRLFID